MSNRQIVVCRCRAYRTGELSSVRQLFHCGRQILFLQSLHRMFLHPPGSPSIFISLPYFLYCSIFCSTASGGENDGRSLMPKLMLWSRHIRVVLSNIPIEHAPNLVIWTTKH